ncbi:hypothetical protein T09_14931 [Trichinella sp. T9]|nr:hypothetical protein T09_14931 [Trichinella sp. T9]
MNSQLISNSFAHGWYLFETLEKSTKQAVLCQFKHFWHFIWVCIEIQQQRLLPGLVLTPTNFQHLTNRLSQPRTKLYCSEISSKLFPDYYDRRTAKWTRSTVSFMCTVILTFPLILAW